MRQVVLAILKYSDKTNFTDFIEFEFNIYLHGLFFDIFFQSCLNYFEVPDHPA